MDADISAFYTVCLRNTNLKIAPKVLINGSYYNVLTTNDTITAVFG